MKYEVAQANSNIVSYSINKTRTCCDCYSSPTKIQMCAKPCSTTRSLSLLEGICCCNACCTAASTIKYEVIYYTQLFSCATCSRIGLHAAMLYCCYIAAIIICQHTKNYLVQVTSFIFSCAKPAQENTSMSF